MSWFARAGSNEGAQLFRHRRGGARLHKFLRDDERRSSKSATLSRVPQARAVEIEQRTARASAQTVELSEALALVDVVIGEFEADLNGLPARLTRDMDKRRRLEAEINDIIARAADQLDPESADLKRMARLIRPRPRYQPDVWAAKNALSRQRRIPGPRDPTLTPYMIDWSRALASGAYRRCVMAARRRPARPTACWT